jgi:DNA-binding NarL/FixJ family response regulator
MVTTNGTAKRVLLVESGRFIGGVIHSLFSGFEHTEVITASPANGRELLKAIEEQHPNVIVLDDTLQAEYLHNLLRYLQVSADLRVLVLNTNSNSVQIYQKQEVEVLRPADLLMILSA